jgi:hypothetical protein
VVIDDRAFDYTKGDGMAVGDGADWRIGIADHLCSSFQAARAQFDFAWGCQSKVGSIAIFHGETVV